MVQTIELCKPLRLSARVFAGLLILRLVVGLAFNFHGYGKIQNPFGWMGPNAGVPVGDGRSPWSLGGERKHVHSLE